MSKKEKKDSLGDRMKSYENVTRHYLTRRMPVIIRLDSRAGHTFTRGFRKPFDDVFAETMQETMLYLCKNIQNCVFGYTQSDEISLILVDYEHVDTNPWFDNNVLKITSISASMATLAFNRIFERKIREWYIRADDSDENINYMTTLEKALEMGLMFDSRAFNVPKEDVCNCILWRQNDATKNSISMVAHANFSTRELHGKHGNDMQDMLMMQKGINWNDFPADKKRGSACIKVEDEKSGKKKWKIDLDMPILKGDGRKYIEDLIYFD